MSESLQLTRLFLAVDSYLCTGIPTTTDAPGHAKYSRQHACYKAFLQIRARAQRGIVLAAETRDWVDYVTVATSTLVVITTAVYVALTHRLVREARNANEQTLSLYRDALAPRCEIVEDFRRISTVGPSGQLELGWIIELAEGHRAVYQAPTATNEIAVTEYNFRSGQVVIGPSKSALQLTLMPETDELRRYSFEIRIVEVFNRTVDVYTYSVESLRRDLRVSPSNPLTPLQPRRVKP